MKVKKSELKKFILECVEKYSTINETRHYKSGISKIKAMSWANQREREMSSDIEKFLAKHDALRDINAEITREQEEEIRNSPWANISRSKFYKGYDLSPLGKKIASKENIWNDEIIYNFMEQNNLIDNTENLQKFVNEFYFGGHDKSDLNYFETRYGFSECLRELIRQYQFDIENAGSEREEIRRKYSSRRPKNRNNNFD